VIYGVRYALISLYTAFWASVACVAALFGRGGEVGVFAARHWARWIQGSCGVEVVCEGLEHVAADQPCVVMSNHQSVFDITALASTLPLPWRFVAKRELTWIPFFGWGLLAAGHVVIDRGDNERSVRSMKLAAERVRKGTSVMIFPEGTRGTTAELRAFKSGGFHLAIQAGVPILPVSISGSRRITPPGSLRVESGQILVRYGEPIPTEGLSVDDRGRLKEQLRQALLAGFDPELQA
jgi:1-acyl-sn-glycerol-3-phosphate acyltransferase